MLPRSVKSGFCGVIAAALIAAMVVEPISVETARAQAKGASSHAQIVAFFRAVSSNVQRLED